MRCSRSPCKIRPGRSPPEPWDLPGKSRVAFEHGVRQNMQCVCTWQSGGLNRRCRCFWKGSPPSANCLNPLTRATRAGRKHAGGRASWRPGQRKRILAGPILRSVGPNEFVRSPSASKPWRSLRRCKQSSTELRAGDSAHDSS